MVCWPSNGMKKIAIEKGEDIAEIVDRILESPDTSIVLVVPRGTTLGKSVRSFHLLKREAEATGRTIEIESVDDSVLAFAREVKIPARHPLLNRSGGSVSDIVAVAHEEIEETFDGKVPSKGSGKKSGSHKRAAEVGDVPVKIEVRGEAAVLAVEGESAEEEEGGDEGETGDGGRGDETSSEEPSEGFFGGNRFFKQSVIPDDDETDKPRQRSWWKWVLVAVLVVVIVAVAIFVVDRLFGHAKIAIDFQKTPWQYQASIAADKSIAAVNLVQKSLPAEVFTASKNVTQSFPASGMANVSLKAHGTLTIYNAYSSAPQTLVATTRFATPDGKIFRLTNEVIVPGAQVTNGQIVPSSITAPIVADQAGPDYNIGPVAKLLIPGFQKTPKYAGFYGVIASGTSGGFVGNKAVPTAQDVTAAKASTTVILQAALKNTTALNIPSNFKILDGASNVAIARLVVSTTTDASGTFTVFGQVSYQAIGFDESMLKSILLNQAQTAEANSTFSDIALTYTNVTPNFSNGTMTFTVAAQGSLEPAFSPNAFASSVAGMSIGNARAAVAGLTNLVNGSISVWPVWLWNLPSDSAKISVTVD